MRRLFLLCFALSALGIRAGQPTSGTKTASDDQLRINWKTEQKNMCKRLSVGGAGGAKLNCKIVKIKPAGKDAENRQLTLVELSYLPEFQPSDISPSWTTGTTYTPPPKDYYKLHEYWLYVRKNGESNYTQLLKENIYTSYLSNMNTVFLSGSNWISIKWDRGPLGFNGSTYLRYRLSPWQLLEKNTDSLDATEKYELKKDWSWENFKGHILWKNHHCDSEGIELPKIEKVTSWEIPLLTTA